jgi:hypothetical protein
MQGITNPICKESPSNAPLSGKIDYFQPEVSDSKSMASDFFTDDWLIGLQKSGAKWTGSGATG